MKKIEGGRAVGFAKSITVPVVVIPQENLNFFLSSDIANLTIEYEPITSQGIFFAFRFSISIFFAIFRKLRFITLFSITYNYRPHFAW
jgi:hypothetical protein